MHHYFNSELIEQAEDGQSYISASVMEGDAGWLVAYNGRVHRAEDAVGAFNVLQALRADKDLPNEHRAAIKNLARALWEHMAFVREVHQVMEAAA